MRSSHHDLRFVRRYQFQHLGQLQIVKIVDNLQTPGVRLKYGRIKRVVRKPSGPYIETVFCVVRIEPRGPLQIEYQ